MSILGALMAFTSISTDIYLPALPSMGKELHGDPELTITGFFLGFTFAQLLWGPISDNIGRKLPLFIGTMMFAIGSAGCALSHSIVGLVFVFFSMNGVIAATTTAAALDEVPEIAGSASALLGSLQFGSGIISTLLLALFSKGTPWTMTWVMLVFTAAAFLSVAGKVRK